MIPTLLLVGFCAGLLPRGWLVVPFAAVAWAVLLLSFGIGSGLGFAVAAGALAAVNTAVGLSAGSAVRRLVLLVAP